MAEPNIMFRFRFGAKSAEPELNWTVASVLTSQTEQRKGDRKVHRGPKCGVL